MMKNIEYEPYEVVIVALDLTQMDDQLIRYSAMISKVLPIERIFFVHVARSLELPHGIIEEYPDLLEPIDESINSD